MKDIAESKCPFGFTADEGDDSEQQLSDGETGQRHMGMAKGLARDKLPELVKEPIAPGADGFPTGRCICGNISFQIRRPVEMVFANHDALSRRRSGGVAMTIMTRAVNTVFNGWGHLVHYPVSRNENACFCRVCGTPILTYFLAPEPRQLAGQFQTGGQGRRPAPAPDHRSSGGSENVG